MNHRKELGNMNGGGPGPRHKPADSFFQLLAAVRCLYGVPCRRLEGYTGILHGLVRMIVY